MNVNQQFSVSIHALTLLAASADPLTSEMIAGSVDTNPVVIRRAMAGLRERGLVESRPGAHGGWRLKRSPRDISLRDVYLSLQDDPMFFMHEHPNPGCPIGGNIQPVLQKAFDDAQTAAANSFGRVTIADVLAGVRALAQEK